MLQFDWLSESAEDTVSLETERRDTAVERSPPGGGGGGGIMLEVMEVIMMELMRPECEGDGGMEGVGVEEVEDDVAVVVVTVMGVDVDEGSTEDVGGGSGRLLGGLLAVRGC